MSENEQSLMSRLKAVDADLISLRDEAESLRAELATLKEAAVAAHEYGDMRDAELTSLRAQLADMTEQRRMFSDDDFAAGYKALRAECDQLRAQLAELTAENMGLWQNADYCERRLARAWRIEEAARRYVEAHRLMVVRFQDATDAQLYETAGHALDAALASGD
jgi:chromosome segregation ATPase